MEEEALWTERYTDKRWGEENKGSFNYFQEYLLQNKPRSIKRLHEKIISEIESGNRSGRKIKIDTLYDYSAKWKWRMRADAYDDFMIKERREQRQRQLELWEDEQIPLAMGRCNFLNKNLKDINDDVRLKSTEKSRAMNSNQEAYSKSVDDVYKLHNKGKTPDKIQHEVTADVETKNRTIIEEKSVFEKIDEAKEQLKGIK